MTKRIEVADVCKLLKRHDNFTILCHASADGDTLGSAFGLCRALQKMKKHARVMLPEKISARLEFISVGIEEYAAFCEEFIISVDVADENLLGDLETLYRGGIDLAIDHHGSNVEFAKYLLLRESAAANTEIIFDIIQHLDKLLMDKIIASALYVGIATDTGCFRFANTTAETHRYAYELINYGADIDSINFNLFESKSKKCIEVENEVLSKIEYHFDGRCAIITLTADMLGRVDEEDINGISSLPRQIEGVLLGVTLKEKSKDVWKASLRSTGNINVQKICKKFGGGGHVRASGCKITASLEECKSKLLAEIESNL